jgi:hypothetical protein
MPSIILINYIRFIDVLIEEHVQGIEIFEETLLRTTP